MPTNFKLTKHEQFVAELLAKGIVVILAILFYLVAYAFKLLFKLKRWLFRLSIVILITWSAYTTLHTIAYAPKANASEFQYTQKPLTEHEQIVNYIYDVFGKDADKAFMVLSCENKGLNPNAIHDNEKWGQGKGKDYGIFQINDHWQRTQGKFLLNWKVNIEIAHQLYVENGDFHLWTCGRQFGI